MQIFNYNFMKKNCRILTAMLLALTCCPSCSDKDNELSTTSRISFYGETYPLEQGAIYHDNNHTVIAVSDYTFEDRYQGKDGEQTDLIKGFSAEVKEKQTGNVLIGLYQHGFVLSDLTKDARGNGACICLRLASPETDKIAMGKYTYSPNRDEYSFKGSTRQYYKTGSTTTPNELTEGEVNISQEGEIYTITFKCTTSFGGPIEGTYTGSLKPFDIRKEIGLVNSYENIKLEALFDKVEYTDLEGVAHSEPDYLRANSFLLSSTQQVYSANLYRDLAESTKKGIDIALAYDKENQAIYFESPIKMRALLWHNTFQNESLFDYSFDLPCHTKYNPPPQKKTEAHNHPKNKQEKILIKYTEPKTTLPKQTTTHCFVFVQTGNGMQGVIRIKTIIPESTETINGIIYPVNPAIIMDVKFPRSFSEQQIR